MSGTSRRALLGGGFAALAVAVAAPAGAHTPYRQWVIYRKKHLMLGSHRDDPDGYLLAKETADELAQHLPASRARVARAPAATRLAGLLATDQLDLAVLDPATVDRMRTAAGPFAAYGRVDLQTLLILRDARALVAHARFPADHAALVTKALIDSAVAPAAAQEAALPAPWHPAAWLTLREAGVV